MHEWRVKFLARQVAILAGHCPLICRYFEPCNNEQNYQNIVKTSKFSSKCCLLWSTVSLRRHLPSLTVCYFSFQTKANGGGRLMKVQRTILFYDYFGTLITGFLRIHKKSRSSVLQPRLPSLCVTNRAPGRNSQFRDLKKGFIFVMVWQFKSRLAYTLWSLKEVKLSFFTNRMMSCFGKPVN